MGQPADTRWASEPRTLIKHQIYKRYVDCWMGKILQRFPSATIVDAFAGPGSYSDGPDGSPVVIAKAFLAHTAHQRLGQLRLICNEGRPDRRQALASQLAALPRSPKLRISVPPANDFASAYAAVASAAHPRGEPLPTLWVLDPFDLKSLPFALVRQCLCHERDEVLVTWFADEIYRFCETSAFEAALEEHFGGGHWRNALQFDSEGRRKTALVAAYRQGLETLPNVKTGALSISSKNETARYSIILATHSDSGLACWNPVKWNLDPAAGTTVSEKRVVQDALWDERGPLRAALEGRAGTAATFEELRTAAGRLGFLDRQLRVTLDELLAEGRAVREAPLDSRTPWPDGCLVRFYDVAAESGGRS